MLVSLTLISVTTWKSVMRDASGSGSGGVSLLAVGEVAWGLEGVHTYVCITSSKSSFSVPGRVWKEKEYMYMYNAIYMYVIF